MNNTIDPKKLQEARSFTASVVDQAANAWQNKEAMQKTLDKFNKIAQKVAGSVAQEAQYNPAFREALHTREVQYPGNNLYEQSPNSLTMDQYGNFVPKAVSTPQYNGYDASSYTPTPTPVQQPTQTVPVMGVQRGNYAVFPIPEGKTYRFEVINITEQKKLVGDLKLNDSADAIVKLLNRNYSFYSPEVQSVLQLEQTYTKHYNDCLSFKRKANDKVLEETMKVRFAESKNKLLLIKEQLIEFNKKII